MREEGRRPLLLDVVALVLVASGAFKLADPGPTGEMLRSLGLRVGAVPLARCVGVVECGLGLAAIALGGPVTASLVAAAYSVFAVVALVLVLRSRRGAGISSCGCFGQRSAPPSAVLVVVDVCCALVAAAAVLWPRAGVVVQAWRGELEPGLTSMVQAGLVVLAAWLVFSVMTTLPDTLEAARRVPPTRQVRLFGVGEVDS